MNLQWKQFDVVKPLGKRPNGKVLLVKDTYGLKTLKLLKIDPVKLVGRTEAKSYATQHNTNTAQASQILKQKRAQLLLSEFKHEAETLKKLNHPNIARFYDVGYIQKKEQYYLLYEYIEGDDIFKFTREIPFEKMEALFVELLRGVHYLLNRNISCLNLKTENILIQQDSHSQPIPKITDFAIADGPSNSRYRAPEVWLEEPKDHRTDLYSLGIIFYRCLTGSFPFEGESPTVLKSKHSHSTPIPPSRKAKIPPYWDRIILRLLEKNPNNRYPSAASVIRDIQLFSEKNYEVETSETRMSYLPNRGNLIGRNKEIAWFDQKLKNVFTNHHKIETQLLIIRGSFGAGKSRLLEEFGFYAKLNYGLTVLGWDELQDPPSFSDPILFLLDESEKKSREILKNALLRDRESPVLFVFVENDAAMTWPQGEEITLKEFNLGQVKEYLQKVVRSDEPPLPFVQKIYEMTQGTPLLLTELVSSCITKGILVDGTGPWPQSLLEDISLPRTEELSSIASENFCVEEIKGAHLNESQQKMSWILSALREAPTREELADTTGKDPVITLYPLLNRHILFTETEGKICFKRSSLKTFVYKNIPPNEKNQIHQMLAHFFEKRKNTKEALWHRGLMEELAQIYEKESCFERAIPCYQKMLQECPQDNILQKSLIQTKLANAFFLTGRFEEARLEAHRVLLDPSLANHPEMIDILLEINDLCLKLSLRERNLKETEERIEFVIGHFIPFLLHPKNKVKKLFFENRRAQFFLMKNNLDQAESLFMETQKEAESLSPQENEKLTNNDCDEVYFLKNKLSKAREACEKKLNQTNSIVQKNRCHYLLGRIFLKQNNTKEALAQWNQCIASAKALNDIPSLFRAYNELGNFYFEKESHPKKAKDYWERSLLLAQKAHDSLSTGAISSNLGRLFNQQKDYHQAYHYLIFALHSFGATSDSPMIMSQLTGTQIELAQTLRHLKERDKAEKLLSEIESRFPHPVLKHLEFWLYLELTLNTLKANRPKRESYLEKAKQLAKSELEKKALKGLEY